MYAAESEVATNPMYAIEGADQIDDVEADIEMQPVGEDYTEIDDENDEPVVTGKADQAKDLRTKNLGYNILVLLFALGIISGLMNGCVQWVVGLLSQAQAQLIMVSDAGPVYFLMTTTALCALSAYIIKAGKQPATTGAGMAEVKSVLVSDFHPTEFPKLLSLKIAALRITSLITAAGSGLSVGLAAPLTHSTVCFAFALIKFVPDFGELIENPSMLKQIFAAASAVGFTSVANTPVGGLLFSIEVTSAYYLISNYWRSFMAATAGAVIADLVMVARHEEGRFISMNIVGNPYNKVEYFSFAILGLVCGLAGLAYLKMHQAWFLFVKPYTIKHPVATAAVVGTFTALMIFALGAYSSSGVTNTITLRDCFTSGYITSLGKYNAQPGGGILASLILRVILTMLGTTLRISAGILICVLTIGAQMGRLFGLIVQGCVPNANIFVGGYAMVGAVAFASATTHTISAAVLIVEMTGEIDMLLPCLIGAVIACGITKSRTLSLYDQGMVNKGLESFELLMQDTSGFSVAGEVMDKRACSVTNTCTLSDLLTLLRSEQQLIYPVIDSAETLKLVGSVDRQDIFLFLKARFEEQGLGAFLRAGLPVDSSLEDKRQLRIKKLENRRAWIKIDGQEIEADNAEGHIRRGLFPSPYQLRFLHTDEEGNPVSVRSKLQNVYSRIHSAAQSAAVKISSSTSDLHAMATGATPGGSTHDREALSEAAAVPVNMELVDSLLQCVIEISGEPQLPMNLSPFTAHRSTSLDQLYVLFEMVKVSCVFVVTQDKTLEGMISKGHLLQSLRKKVT